MLKRTILALAVAVGAWAPPLPAQTHVPETHRIDIQDFAFVPTRIEVHVGDIVEWTNRDFAPHTATADNGAWDTGAIKNEATGRFVATTPGTLAYHCAFHPRMQGVITVVAGTAVQSSRRELPEPAILSMIPWGGFGRVEACSQRRDVADWALSVSYPDVDIRIRYRQSPVRDIASLTTSLHTAKATPGNH